MPWENRRVDVFIPILVAFLMVIGLFAIYSATRDYGTVFVRKQITWNVLGLAALFLTMLFRERDLHRLSWILYVLCLMSLTLVLFFGTVSGGARRWFDLKIGYFQPSELAKICVILITATMLMKVSAKHIFFFFPDCCRTCRACGHGTGSWYGNFARCIVVYNDLLLKSFHEDCPCNLDSFCCDLTIVVLFRS